jgi:hypothetical protein
MTKQIDKVQFQMIPEKKMIYLGRVGYEDFEESMKNKNNCHCRPVLV